MADYGYLRISAASPKVNVANPKANLAEMLKLSSEAISQGTNIIVFPELFITGCSCGDLFKQKYLIEQARKACLDYVKWTEGNNIISIFGCPLTRNGRLLNCAFVVQSGKILSVATTSSLEDGYERCFDILDDQDDFVELSPELEFWLCKQLKLVIDNKTIAISIGQKDLLQDTGTDIVINLAHSHYDYSEQSRSSLLSALSSAHKAAYISCVAGCGESTQDYVWTSDSYIYECGDLLAKAEPFAQESQLITADIDLDRLNNHIATGTGFCEVDKADTKISSLRRPLNPLPFIPKDLDFKALLYAQVAALCTRLDHIGCRKVVLGVSGGLDSTLALIVAALTFDKLQLDRDGIIGITMPGFGTSGRTKGNSDALLRLFGVQSRCISIVEATRQHFKDIDHAEDAFDTTFENAQARERTQILMDVAGMEGGIVIGTGDLSEIALGWCTYNGDHMSMYGVNSSLPKTLIRATVTWAAEHLFEGELSRVLLDIVDTPISPELVPTDDEGQIAQKTESIVGPYELHDFFLYNMLRWGYSPEKLLFVATKTFEGIYDEQTISYWLKKFLKRFFTQQFKRSCSPDGAKVGPVSLSPRGGWLMPSDLEQAWTL